MIEVLPLAIVFVAALLQTTSGFGFALIVMPLLTLVLGIQTAAPLVALLGFTLYAINLIRYRRAFNRQEVIKLAAAAALGVPLGVWALASLDEGLVKLGLGVILVVYAGYALWQPRAFTLRSGAWSYPAGFLAGVLGGAYNTPGPPLIVYGNLRDRPRDEFRSTLQALFLVSSALVIAAHWAAGHLSPAIGRAYALALPTLLLGILAGSWVDRRLRTAGFRTLVTAMILLLGLSLIFLH
jgi:hypothetical protein